MFDVTNKESFESIDRWISDIKEVGENDKVIIFIGNKIDATDQREINKKDAKERANKYNIKYIESSCLNGLNLYEILNEIILGGYYKYYENEKKNRKDSIKLQKSDNNNNNENQHKRKCC